jgi:NAD(P)-dependent dehydrogenase (short-subunit alcohol dehydrogenase family)
MKKLIEMFNLQDKWVVITGAAGHLGSLFSETLAELGSNLILIDIDQAKLNDLRMNLISKYKIQVEIKNCNLELPEQRKDLIIDLLKCHKRLDILINNAAFVGTAKMTGWNTDFKNQSIETWKRALEVNLTAAFDITKGLTPLLFESISPKIVNIASIYGEFGPDWSLYEGTNMANPAAYSVSKAGLIQMTKWLATTLAPDIRVNAISPGGIFRQQNEIFTNRYSERTPLKRMAKEEDIIGALIFLVTDMSDYVTGQIINVDGGWGIW